MTEKDMITMSRKETRRLHIIHQVLEKKLTHIEAASLWVCRPAATQNNQAGTARRRWWHSHRTRGKTSNHRIPKKIKDKALTLFRERYADFNVAHATEKLHEVDGITVNDETLGCG